MRRLLTAAQAKETDRYTIEEIGIPSVVLMERAALSVAEACMRLAAPEQRILCVCGTGNNGADGIAVARILHLKGYRTEILLAGKEEKGTEEFHVQLRAAKNLRIPLCKANEPDEYIKEDTYGLIVDALFGVGLTRQVEGMYALLITQMNRSGTPVVAVDIPSGVSADDGRIMGCGVRAAVTVTFGEEKLGMILYPGTEYCGERVIADIGLVNRDWERTVGSEERNPLQAVESVAESANGSNISVPVRLEAGPWMKDTVFTYDREDMRLLPKRPAYSNKGTFGRVLVIAGSPAMGGAAVFAGMAAYRMGAGLVEIATARENRACLQQVLPEAILTIYGNTENPEAWLRPAMRKAKAIVIGPGLGTEGNGAEILRILLAETTVPLVIDADGLNLLAASEELAAELSRAANACRITLTPHLGEMARLTGKTVREIQQNLIASAREYSRKTGTVCVMKDARTVVASPDGRTYVNTSGNCGMAVGGSGDLLAGMIGALQAESMPVFESACLGVWLHGLYGDRARERYGERSMIATDLANIIGETE